MAGSKQTREERLLKKRQAQQRLRDRIKSNPELYEKLKEKDRKRIHEKKKAGLVKKIGELDSISQAAARKRQGKYSLKHYYKKQQLQSRCLDEDLVIIPEEEQTNNSDPLASTTDAEDTQKHHSQSVDNLPVPPSPSTSTPSQCRCLVDTVPTSVSSDNATVSRPITRSSVKKLLTQPKCSALPEQMKRYYNNTTGPSSSVLSLSPRRFRHREHSTAPASPSSSRSSISRCSTPMSGNILSPSRKIQKPKDVSTKACIRQLKYRMNMMFKKQGEKLNLLQKKTEQYRKQIFRLQYKKTKQEKHVNQNLVSDKEEEIIDSEKTLTVEEEIKKFFEEDENSRICSGKKEFITRKLVKKQKRFLNANLKELYEKFQKLNPNAKVSYSHFCKQRPFWVLRPNVNQRETCLCITHENMELMAIALKKNQLIKENSVKNILSSVCCDYSNLACLKRECEKCKTKKVVYQEFDNSTEAFYWSWTKKKKTYMKNGVPKETVHTSKEKIDAHPKELINAFEKMLAPYMNHCAIMIAQATFIKKLKNGINEEECVIHCDFSENYCTKYANEIQAVHFAGNRQQITMHTVVIYYRKNGVIKTQALCTLSECLRHDAAAIWQHLQPILEFIENEAPGVHILHFISDSPSSQYRNRNMFYVISKLSWCFPSLTSVSWNYTESGHGKGAPDGVGATLKRTADQLVAGGTDIPNMTTLITHLMKIQSVIIKTVDEAAIFEKDMLMATDLKPFKGTMKVHQVIWDSKEPNKLAMRRLSCGMGECKNGLLICEHGHEIGYFEVNGDVDRGVIPTNEKNKCTKGQPVKKSKRVSENKTKILSNILVRPADIVKKKSSVRQLKSVLKDTDINIPDDDSFWANVSTDCENVAPTLAKEILTNIAGTEIDESDSESEDYNIF